MDDSGPSRRRGWIPRVRVIPRNGLDSFGDVLETRFRTHFRTRGTVYLSHRGYEPVDVRTAVGSVTEITVWAQVWASILQKCLPK